MATFPCPHCAKDIENLVQKAEMDRRLKAKDGEIEATREELAEVTAKAKQADSIPELTKERDSLKAKIAEMSEAGERSALLVERGMTNAKAQRSVGLIYESEMAGRDEKDRMPFADWLAKDAPSHPLLAGKLEAKVAAPAAGAGTNGAGTNGKPAGAPPPSSSPNNGVNPTPPSGTPPKWTPQGVREFFRSPAYLGLDAKARIAKRAEVEAEVKAQGQGGSVHV